MPRPGRPAPAADDIDVVVTFFELPLLLLMPALLLLLLPALLLLLLVALLPASR